MAAGTNAQWQENLADIATDLDAINTSTASPNVTDRWARQLGQVDLARVLGAALSATNPVLTLDQIRSLVSAGKAFRVTTGYIATATNTNALVGIQLIANNISKTVVIYNILCSTNSSLTKAQLFTAATSTADSNLTTDLSTSVVNQRPASATASALTSIKCSPANITATSGQQGTAGVTIPVASGTAAQVLQGGSQVYIAAGEVASASFYLAIPTAANTGQITVEWVEF